MTLQYANTLTVYYMRGFSHGKILLGLGPILEVVRTSTTIKIDKLIKFFRITMREFGVIIT